MLALFPYIVYSGTTAILVQAFIVLTLASMWNLLAGLRGPGVGRPAGVRRARRVLRADPRHATALSPFAALPVAAIGCGVAALPLWWLVSRLRSGYFAIATWVLAATVMLFIERFSSLGGGTGMPLPGLTGFDPTLLTAYTYWAGLAVTVLAIAAIYLLLRGRLGLVLTAIRDDEIAARSSGRGSAWPGCWCSSSPAPAAARPARVLAISQLQVVAERGVSACSGPLRWPSRPSSAGSARSRGRSSAPSCTWCCSRRWPSYNAWYLIILGLVAIVVALFARRGLWGLVDEPAQRPAVPGRVLAADAERRSRPARLPHASELAAGPWRTQPDRPTSPFRSG